MTVLMRCAITNEVRPFISVSSAARSRQRATGITAGLLALLGFAGITLADNPFGAVTFLLLPAILWTCVEPARTPAGRITCAALLLLGFTPLAFLFVRYADYLQIGPYILWYVFMGVAYGQFTLLRIVLALHTFVWLYFFNLLYPMRRANAGRRPAAAGGCILVRRAALEAAGGFASIRGEVIDDDRLGQIPQRAGDHLPRGSKQDQSPHFLFKRLAQGRVTAAFVHASRKQENRRRKTRQRLHHRTDIRAFGIVEEAQQPAASSRLAGGSHPAGQ